MNKDTAYAQFRDRSPPAAFLDGIGGSVPKGGDTIGQTNVKMLLAAMLALFVAFVWFVLIANGGAMLGGRALLAVSALLVIADAAMVALGDGCGWCITVFLVTLAAVAAAVARTLRGSS